MFKKMKIGVKILLVVLGVSLGAMMLIFIDMYNTIGTLGRRLEDTNKSLNAAALDNISDVVLNLTEQYLEPLLYQNVIYCDNRLWEISKMVVRGAEYVNYIYANSRQFVGKDVPEPEDTADGEASAKYIMAPDAGMTDDIEREIRMLSNCEPVFQSALSGDDMIGRIYVGTQSGIYYEYSASNKRYANYDPRKRIWYKAAMESGGYAVFTDTYASASNDTCITCAQVFYDDQGNAAGVVAADIVLDEMLKEIIFSSEYGGTFLAAQDGTIIAHPDYFKEGFKKDFDSHIQGAEIESAHRMMWENGEFQIVSGVTVDGSKSYLAMMPVRTTGWVMYFSINEEYMTAPALATKQDIGSIIDDAQKLAQNDISNARRRFIFFFAAIGVGVILISYALSRSITKPIQRLSANVAQIGAGKLDIKIPAESSDEIGSLAETFNRMLDDLRNHINKVTLITAEKERIGAELNVAAQIQADMLPSIFPAFPHREEFDIYATMNPAKEVGGDFYDFFMIDDTHLAMVMADVSGKGVPAALFMVIGKTLIKDHTKSGTTLGDVFTEVNNLLCESNKEGLFITAFECVLDLKTGNMVYVNAGHEPPFIAKYGETYKKYEVTPQFVLAGLDGMAYSHGEIRLDPGDRIFLYTDGATDAMNTDEQLYGMERLGEVLKANAEKKPQELLDAVKKDIDIFVGTADQFDDITMLGMEYKKKMDKITVKAEIAMLDDVTNFADAFMESCGYDAALKTQVDIVIDEIYANICSYAYPDGAGEAEIGLAASGGSFELTFTDSGLEYNPLERKDPDIDMKLEERKIGGLGIFIVKKSMDEISYEHKDGQNILRIKKNI